MPDLNKLLKIDGYPAVSGVCPGVPVVVGRRGVERYLHPDLNVEETEQSRAAAEAVRG